MKKLLLITIGIFISVLTFSQATISFYTNNGKTKVKSLKYDKFSDLKVKVKLPSYYKKYDDVELKISLSSIDVSAYLSTQDVKVSNYWVSAWILSPNKKPGEFEFSDGAKINAKDLFETPRNYSMEELTITMSVYGYKKTGTETYYDDYSNSWKTRSTWSKGKLFNKDSIIMTDIPLITTFKSKDGLVSGTYVNAKIGGTYFDSSKKRYFVTYKNNKESSLHIGIKLLKKSDIKSNDKYAELKAKNPDLTPYQFIKNDLVAWIGKNNTNVNFATSSYSKNAFFLNPIYKWADIFDLDGLEDDYCHTAFDVTKKDDKHKGLKSMLADWSPKFYKNPQLWSQKKIGNYNYDYLHLDDFDEVKNTSYENSLYVRNMGDRKAKLDIYTTDLGDYIAVIMPVNNEHYRRNLFLKDYDNEIALTEKTLEKIKFLK